ncbi:MAG: hypothetical protein NTV87_15125, partial [Ignavibacteriae bacterium]|nr:hypothetical protein [Ignavibacteriota bacterium]
KCNMSDTCKMKGQCSKDGKCNMSDTCKMKGQCLKDGKCNMSDTCKTNTNCMQKSGMKCNMGDKKCSRMK